MGEGALDSQSFMLVAGPCSAESREQVLAVAAHLKTQERVDYFRAGVWKPRTRPGSFEGRGEAALPWLAEVQDGLGLRVAVEVATPAHVEAARAHGIRAFWIGARTTTNPFAVQELAEAFAPEDEMLFVKNPISPDLDLWIGAIERLYRQGVRNVVAVHRGFYPQAGERYRNSPRWDVVLGLRSRLPHLPILCDPSHIAGRREWVGQVAARGLDFSMDGLFVEVHPRPECALSDSAQQLTFEEFDRMLSELRFPHKRGVEVEGELADLRMEIDALDEQILGLIGQRMGVVRQIGEWKHHRNMRPYREARWTELLRRNHRVGQRFGLKEEFVQRVCGLIHAEALRIQGEQRGDGGEEAS